MSVGRVLAGMATGGISEVADAVTGGGIYGKGGLFGKSASSPSSHGPAAAPAAPSMDSAAAEQDRRSRTTSRASSVLTDEGAGLLEDVNPTKRKSVLGY